MAFLSFDDGGVLRATNCLPYSEALDNVSWGKTTGVTVGTGATSPDGTNSANSITYDGSGTAGNFRVFQGALAPLDLVPAGYVFTLSIWLRAGSAVTLRIGNNHGDFTTCAVTTQWQRFSVTGTGTGLSAAQLLLYSPAGVNTAFTVYAWGAQAELGSRATAYIPTTSAAASAAFVECDYPEPANRFSNWTPMTRPYGDAVHTLASGALVMFRHRTDYGASFTMESIPRRAQVDNANRVAMADRLVAHLLGGGTCLVQTNGVADGSYANLASVFKTCGLWPGATPSLQQTDRQNMLYSLSLQLVNLDGVAMNVVYA